MTRTFKLERRDRLGGVDDDDVAVDDALVGDEADGLELGLYSCEEEERQASAAESYLQARPCRAEGVGPSALVKRKDLGGLVTLALPAQPTLMAAESRTGTSRSPRSRDSPGCSF